MVARSQVVHLTLVGMIGALVAARLLPAGPQMRSNLYNSRADCERDYSPAQCASYSGGSSSGGTRSFLWHGPAYVADRSSPAARGDPGPGRVGLASAVSSLRGGFGAFGRAFGAGG